MRPDCLKPVACIAKTPGKHCHKCMMTARNKSAKQREAAKAEKLKNPTLTPEVIARSRTPEARQKAIHNRREREMAWCPAEYRTLYSKLTRSGPAGRYSAGEARAMIEEAVKKDNREVVQFETFSERISRSHENRKRGGSIYGGSISPIDNRDPFR